MKCPKCVCTHSLVLETRTTKAHDFIRRQRQCSACKFKFATYEVSLNIDDRRLVKILLKGKNHEMSKT